MWHRESFSPQIPLGTARTSGLEYGEAGRNACESMATGRIASLTSASSCEWWRRDGGQIGGDDEMHEASLESVASRLVFSFAYMQRNKGIDETQLRSTVIADLISK